MSGSRQEITADALHWINGELVEIFDSAARAIERFERDDSDRDALKEVAASLHSAAGALRMVEVHGAALLAEEMVQVTRALHERKLANPQEGLEALSRALLQMPEYLERVAGGGHDIPLILLPLLNDLRAVRGHPLLSESSLFILNVDRVGLMPERSSDGRHTDIRLLASKLRAPYQTSLLNWLRGVEPQKRLHTLAEIAQRFEQASSTARVFQVWWVLGGIVEAVIEGGLRPSASIKRLLGQGDRQIKSLAAHGEDHESEREAVQGFLNNLLFYVGRATSDGPKVTAIRSAYGLERMREPADTVDTPAHLNTPSINLMKTVGAAIRQDLGQVKDAIDLLVRSGGDDRSVLTGQVSALTKIADTLGVLGLADLHQQMAMQSGALQSFVDGHGEPVEALMPIASALIRCESALDEQLVQRTVAADQHADAARLSPTEMAARSDRQAVVEAVLRECVVNLGKAKEALSQFAVNPGNDRVLEAVPRWLRGIEAGLRMLEKPRAMDLVGIVGWHVEQLRVKGLEHLAGNELERLADSIVSIEYFMETVRKGRRDPEYMLDNAATCLSSLSRQPPAQAPEPEPLAEDTSEDLAPSHPEEVAVAPAANESLPRIEDLDNAVVADARVHVDPELLELFIEEAKEEIATLNRQLPRWREQPENRELLLAIRRAYHTLKGSGRMVGARVMAEFGWSIEELLNGLINQEVNADDTLYQVLFDAQEALPQLVEQLEVGTAPTVDLNDIVGRAAQLLGRAAAQIPGEAETEAEIAPSADEAPLADEELAATTLTLDPVLYEIFGKEAQGHLEVIDAFLLSRREQPAPHRIDDSLNRAWHTLCGSANMAAVEPVVAIAEPINEFLRGAMNAGGLLGDRALATLEQASRTVATLLQRINTPQQAPEIEPLLLAISELEPLAVVADEAPGATTVVFDPEVAAIFAEEAEELLGVADPALDAWLIDPSGSAAAMSELLRHLHTLKGGARMARVQTMATLSHELESVFERINAGEQELTEALGHALRLGFDRLHVMQETVAAGALPLPAEDVLSQLQEAVQAPSAHAPPETLEVLEPGAPETAVEQAAAEEIVASGTSEQPPAVEQTATEASASEQAAAEQAAAEQAAAEQAAAEQAAAEQAAAEQAAAEQAAAEQAAAEQAAAEQAAAEQAAAEQAAAEQAAAEQAAAEQAAAEQAAAEQAAAERAAAEQAAADKAAAERAAQAAREDVANMADEMAELVEELRDAGDHVAPLPPTAVASGGDAFEARLAAVTQSTRAVAAVPTARATEGAERPGELARVDARLLDDMLNNAGEVSIFHSRIEQEIGSIGFNLTELSQTVVRLRDQLRQLDAETEAQIRYRHQDDRKDGEEFDPLELDRYSTIQQLSRALGESVSDLVSIQDLLSELTRESESLLVQQARVTTELQDSLIRTRMLPFSNFTPRLERVVRSAARDLGKNVQVAFSGESGELDRQVLQRMMPAFEHLLRNAVVHGIESPHRRRELGKDEVGQIDVSLRREGTEMAIRIRDDGAGLDIERIKAVAQERGLIAQNAEIASHDALNLILVPGFSTASQVTQEAGRGVGMDVVANEIKLLGGSLAVDSKPGMGSEFTARLPLTLAISQALLVRCGDDQFAIPLPAVEGIVRVPHADVEAYLSDPSKRYVYGTQEYRFEHLGRYVGTQAATPEASDLQAIPVVLVRAGEHSTALIADEMIGSREVVVKSVGPLVSGIPGIAGATILGDGSIVMILDVATLVRRAETVAPVAAAPKRSDDRPLILVVDDSITVRRVTQRLLERNNMRVMTAKDGIDAVALMNETLPDLVLLDIEMPRMDGYEVSTHIRNSDQLRHLPIIMVTSRTGDKHRSRAFELGVDGYLGKPYQEAQLLDAIHPLLAREDASTQQGGT